MKSSSPFLTWNVAVLAFGLLFALTEYHCRAQIITLAPTRLMDFFPHTTQGENGIFLQYRLLSDGAYSNLLNNGDQVFTFAPGPIGGNIPQIEVTDPTNNWVFAHPSFADFPGDLVQADAVIRVTLNGDYGSVLIQGSTYDSGTGQVGWYIYSGESGYGSPIWSTNYQGLSSFSLVVSYTAGDQLFLATTSLGGTDFSDWAMWNIQFQGVSAPTSPPLPPFIVAALGASVTLSNSAAGSTPISYQWVFDGTPIMDATNAYFAIPSATETNVGLYSEIISNPYRSITNGPLALWLDTIRLLPVALLYGPLGSNCLVQTTTNLTPPVPWTSLTNVTIQTIPQLILDPAILTNSNEMFQFTPQ